MTPKKLGKSLLCLILERQVKQLRRRNRFTVVAVAGSVGKTSTKFAIARTLGGSRKVRFQDGNYNDRLTVPLVVFGQTEPAIYDLFGWARIILGNQAALRRPYAYEVVVLELGTDAPGQMKQFAYLKPEIVVITSIAAEHMLYFRSLEAVAKEELTPLEYAGRSLINADDVPTQYLPDGSLTYGTGKSADYRLARRRVTGLDGQDVRFELTGGRKIETHLKILGAQGAKAALGAVAVADLLGLAPAEISQDLAAITPVAGRMRVLPGQQGSTIIDDTYNASPVAVLAALEVLQAAKAKRRIAILGSMNELGEQTAADHRQVGQACDPKKIDLVVTIGQAAKEHLAPAARQRGCQVESFLSPVDAGRYVKDHLAAGAVVLAKGSQNGVFAEEAVKQLLADPQDADKLVRQSAYWLKRKRAQLG